MARHAGLTRPLFALLAAGVLVAHVGVIDVVGDMLERPSALQAMPVVMYTRTLAPAPPPPLPAPAPVAKKRVVRKRAAAIPAPAASQPVAVAPEPAPEPPPPPVPEPPAAPALAAAPEAPPAPPPDAPKGPDLATWPADTRLAYNLGGQFRSGPLFGDANVQWQRDGARYQVRAEVNVRPWAHLLMTSQGEVGPDGLLPAVYEEETRGRKRRRATFEPDYVRLDNGQPVARPASVQDTASQFVELGHRFATGAAQLRAGEPVTVWLARPGGVDLWTYDVTGPEPLQTRNHGVVDAFHLTPRPIANVRGNIRAEMWFAPALQHLPVRIRLLMGEADNIDLTLDTIEQR